MTEQETRYAAAANELAQLLAQANARCANFAGDLVVANTKIAELQAEIAKMKEPQKPDGTP